MQNRRSEIKLTKCNIVQMEPYSKSHFSALILFGTSREKLGEQEVVKSIQTSYNLKMIIQQKKTYKHCLKRKQGTHQQQTQKSLQEKSTVALIQDRLYGLHCCFCLFLSVTPPLSLGNCRKSLQYKWISGELFSNHTVSGPPIPFLPSLHPSSASSTLFPPSLCPVSQRDISGFKFNLFWTSLGVKLQKHRGTN